jgi:hypothetical protein
VHDDGSSRGAETKFIDYYPLARPADGHAKPFDLVWNESNEDFNGLPMNPEWRAHLDDPGAKPDFEKACSAMIAKDGKTVDTKKMRKSCTSQPSPTANRTRTR